MTDYRIALFAQLSGITDQHGRFRLLLGFPSSPLLGDDNLLISAGEGGRRALLMSENSGHSTLETA
jgi:hypothetical protein